MYLPCYNFRAVSLVSEFILQKQLWRWSHGGLSGNNTFCLVFIRCVCLIMREFVSWRHIQYLKRVDPKWGRELAQLVWSLQTFICIKRYRTHWKQRKTHTHTNVICALSNCNLIYSVHLLANSNSLGMPELHSQQDTSQISTVCAFFSFFSSQVKFPHRHSQRYKTKCCGFSAKK